MKKKLLLFVFLAVLINICWKFSSNSSLKFEIMAKQLYVASQRVL